MATRIVAHPRGRFTAVTADKIELTVSKQSLYDGSLSLASCV